MNLVEMGVGSRLVSYVVLRQSKSNPRLGLLTAAMGAMHSRIPAVCIFVNCIQILCICIPPFVLSFS